MTAPELPKLYCFADDDELMFRTPAALIEHYRTYHEDPCELPKEIEEWSTYPPITHLPSVDGLLDWVMEWMSECGEFGDADGTSTDYLAKACSGPEVQEATNALLHLIAGRLDFPMADEKIRTFPTSEALAQEAT